MRRRRPALDEERPVDGSPYCYASATQPRATITPGYSLEAWLAVLASAHPLLVHPAGAAHDVVRFDFNGVRGLDSPTVLRAARLGAELHQQLRAALGVAS